MRNVCPSGRAQPQVRGTHISASGGVNDKK
jgi:hypothetical protein